MQYVEHVINELCQLTARTNTDSVQKQKHESEGLLGTNL